MRRFAEASSRQASQTQATATRNGAVALTLGFLPQSSPWPCEWVFLQPPPLASLATQRQRDPSGLPPPPRRTAGPCGASSWKARFSIF